MIMTNIKFFTPIKYGDHATSNIQKLIEHTDFYFYLGGRVAEIIPGNVKKDSQAVVLRNGKSSCWKIALKVMSYFTLILPALMLLAKAILRFRYHFHKYPYERKPKAPSPKVPEILKHIPLRILSTLKPTAGIAWLNKNKAPISKLGLDLDSTLTLLEKIEETGEKVGEKLEYLEVKNMDEALEYIKRCPNLKTIVIDDKYIGDEALAQLAASELPHLEALTIKCTDNHGCKRMQGIEALAASNKFPNLCALNLVKIIPQNEGFKAFVDSKNFSKLQSLSIKEGEIDSLDLMELASSPNFPMLQILNLSSNSIANIQALANSKHFPNLRILKLDHFDNGNLELLVNSPHFPNLERLDIYYGCYSLEEIEMLLNSPNYPHLNCIGISAEEKDVLRLNQSPNFYKLKIKPDHDNEWYEYDDED